jgi:tetratricopeptide (TPR) repeat protein
LYLRKMVFPVDLAIIYPLGQQRHWWQWLGCGLFLCGISALAIRNSARRPYLLAGWLWYVGTLVPMIGLVQAGAAAMADRYTYLSLIGIFIVVVWLLSDSVEAAPRWRPVLGPGCLGLLLACALSTSAYLSVWKNPIRVFRHATEVVENNYIAHYQLASSFYNNGIQALAKEQLYRSIFIHPTMAISHAVLGEMLFGAGDIQGAFEQISTSLKLKPDDAEVHAALANVLENSPEPKFHDAGKAVEHAKRACELTRYSRRDFLILLAGTYAKNRQYGEAENAAKKALSVSVLPDETQEVKTLLKKIAELESHERS